MRVHPVRTAIITLATAAISQTIMMSDVYATKETSNDSNTETKIETAADETKASEAVAAPETGPAAVANEAAASPTPQPLLTPPKSEKDIQKMVEKLSPDLKQNCNRHYPGLIQAEVRSACASSSETYARYGRTSSEINCRLEYGEEPRMVMACLIGVTIADDIVHKRDDFKKRLQLCAEHYPKHTEVDAFFQESCLTGIHAPEILDSAHESQKLGFEMCSQITPERSFLGPCAVGLSLAQDLSESRIPAQQNQICEKYFDHVMFHKTYRACLNARSTALAWTGRYDDIIKSCSNVVSDSSSDSEKAACLVGASIYSHLTKKEDVSQRFQKCGDSKVSYKDRDFLACLTAASLLDFTDRNGAERGCQTIFQEKRSRSRRDCSNSLSLFK